MEIRSLPLTSIIRLVPLPEKGDSPWTRRGRKRKRKKKGKKSLVEEDVGAWLVFLL